MEKNQNKSEVLDNEGLNAFFTTVDDGDKNKDLEDNKKTVDNTDNADDNNLGDPKLEESKKEEISPSPQPTTTSTIPVYDNVVKHFVEQGDWEDVLVSVERDGEEVEIPINELTDIDEETFLELRTLQKELKDEEFKSKYISTENLDETTLKMIKLKQQGGDISSLIEQEAKIVHPLKGLDLKNEKIQEGLVRQKYTHLGLEQDMIDFKVNKLKKELSLDTEAEQIIKEINTNFDNYVEEESKKQLAELEEQKQQQKVFRKTMSEAFKNFDLNDNLTKTLLDSSTKLDGNGLSDVEKAFFEAKENPELFAQVTFLLSNPEAYNKQLGVKLKNKANLDTAKKVFSLKKRESTGKKPEINTQRNKSGLDALFNKQE